MDNLQNCCLTCIAENLERFNTAFLKTDDYRLQKTFLFLQRTYASQLLSITTHNNSYVLERKYFKFLIHEHLKELNTKIFDEDDLLEARKRVCEIAPGLQTISFRFWKIEAYSYPPKEFTHAVITHLKSIEILKLNILSNCEDDTLKLISCCCPTLKELILVNCPVTNEGLKNLCPGSESQGLTLKSLELRTVRKLDDGINHLLQTMPSLEKIEYFGFPKCLVELHEEDLRNNILHLLPKYNITTLNIDFLEKVEILLLIAAEVCPHVTKLTTPVMNSNILETIEKFTNLTDLRIATSSLFCQSMDNFLNVNNLLMILGRKLHYLELESFEFTTAVLIHNCPDLETLSLRSPYMQSSDEEETDLHLNKLKSFTLIYNDRRNISVAKSLDMILQSCSILEELIFRNCDFQTSNIYSAILQNFCEQTETLKELKFRCSIIESTLLEAMVMSCKSLKKLSVDSCRNINKFAFLELINILNVNERFLELYWHPYEKDCDFDFSDESD